jgi:hypothetical protein
VRVFPKKERDGWVVYCGAEALVRGLREKQDAHRICYDVMRKGYFKGTVIFARNGRALDIVVPADADLEGGKEEPMPPWMTQKQQRNPDRRDDDYVSRQDRGEGTVDDL